MRERPILFSAPMVRALLDGSKTQTRRVLKQATGPSLSVGIEDEPGVAELSWLWGDGPGHDVHETTKKVACPYGVPGDRLYVRETWRSGALTDKFPPRDMLPHPVWYDADGPAPSATNGKSRRGFHMPRWASRITLEITGVRVERLQDISEADAIAEGIPEDGLPCPRCGYSGWVMEGGDPVQCNAIGCGDGAVDEYKHLWHSINGPTSWEANPWVWVVEFKVIEAQQ